MTSRMQWHHICLTSSTLYVTFGRTFSCSFLVIFFMIAPAYGIAMHCCFASSMVELETNKVPTLSNMLTNCYRYVDDTIAFVKENQINNVLHILNGHHQDIKFTHEIQENGKIPFLDVDLQRNENNKLRLNVYRKKTLHTLEIVCSNKLKNWNPRRYDPTCICHLHRWWRFKDWTFFHYTYISYNQWVSSTKNWEKSWKNGSKACYNTNRHNR